MRKRVVTAFSLKRQQTQQKSKKKKRLTQDPKWNKTQNKKTQTPKKTQQGDMQDYYLIRKKFACSARAAGFYKPPAAGKDRAVKLENLF